MSLRLPLKPVPENAIKPHPTLTEEQIQQFLHDDPEWALVDGMLVRFFTFEDFVQAMAFVNRVALLADSASHHPDIDIRYNRVRLALSSHDAGGLTTRDVTLATQISANAAAPLA